MRHPRSSLNGTGFAIVLTAGVNVFLLLCVCILLTSYRAPHYGVNIQPAETHFTIGGYDRSRSHIITVTPGEIPRFFVENKEVPEGWRGIRKVLNTWKGPDSHTVTVIIACDEAVNIGTVQSLANEIMQRGFTCALVGRPPTKQSDE